VMMALWRHATPPQQSMAGKLRALGPQDLLAFDRQPPAPKVADSSEIRLAEHAERLKRAWKGERAMTVGA